MNEENVKEEVDWVRMESSRWIGVRESRDQEMYPGI